MSYYGDYREATLKIIERVGKKIVLGVPLGLGKPIGFLNAIYQAVEADPSLELTIITGLTLSKPELKNDLEKRFIGPIVERLLRDYEDALYEIARTKQKLPKNINVIEFFLSPGKFLHNTYVQQHYISSSYTNVVDDVMHYGINIIAQQVARSEDGETLSLSSNTDLFKDVLDQLSIRGFPMDKFALVAEVNNNMPYMYNDALIPASKFTHVIDPKHYRTIFALPRGEVSAQEHMIGLYTSALIKDGGSLQIGIGTLSTGVAAALIMRQKHNAEYKQVMKEMDIEKRYGKLIAAEGGLDVFSKGIYASTEMLSDEYLHLYHNDIITKRVYDHIGLQSLLNAGEIDENVTPALVDKLIEKNIITPLLLSKDVQFLQHFGILKPELIYQNGNLVLATGESIPADLKLDKSREKIMQQCLGTYLKSGKLVHAGFFLGSEILYDMLRKLSFEEAQLFDMTRISRTNSMLWNYELAKLQRQHARFVNSAMIITLSGALVSDGLANLQEVSGVGGQFDFVNMAHELEDARSIIICRSTRTVKGDVQSNVLWTYPNMTIPRYLRDVVVTEYGIADCRSMTDSEVIKRLLNITDSRFQNKLLKQAKYYGKLAKNYQIPEEFKHNYPEKMEAMIGKLREKGYCTAYPFGTELTQEELVIKDCLTNMKNYTKKQIAVNLMKSWFVGDDKRFAPYLQRMQMQQVSGVKERIYRSLFKRELAKELS